jgi:hypothetical protein
MDNDGLEGKSKGLAFVAWNMVSLSLGVRLRKDCCKKTQTSWMKF